MTRSIPLLVLIIFCTLTGCLGNRNWEYPPSSRGTYLDVTATTPIPARVVVLPLQDLRQEKADVDYAHIALPLVPYGSIRYDRPETVVNPDPVDEVHFDPPQDFARAIAAELQRAQIFSSVIYADEAQMATADLIVRGTLRSTQWNRTLTTYLLGPLGPTLWFLGLPMGNTTTTLMMEVTLVPANTHPRNPVWSFSMNFQEKLLDSPYYGWEDAVLSYPLALQDALRPAIADLVDITQENPQFWVRAGDMP